MKLRFIYFLLALILYTNYTVAQQVVNSVSYDASTGTLSITGSDFVTDADPANDIDASKITIVGQGGSGYALSTAYNVEVPDAGHFNIILNNPEKTEIDNRLNRNGSAAWDGNIYRIDFAESWNFTGSPALSKPITVSGINSAQITSAEFNFGNGWLTINGSNLKSIVGATNDIDVTKLTISNGTVTYTLTSATPSADISGTSVTIVVQGIDKSMLNYILNKDGTKAESGLDFAITAAEGWNGLGESDPGPNALTVSSYIKPQVSLVAYDTNNGVLTVTGSYLASVAGSSNDIDASKFQITGYQGGVYTLNSSFNVDLINETSFKITLTGTDRAQVQTLLNKDGISAWDGTSYNLQLSDGWNCGITGSADLVNSITVSGAVNQPPTVLNVSLGGDLINQKSLSVSFNYFDLENDPAGSHIIKWFTYTDNLGSGKTQIAGETSASYTLKTTDIGLFINAEITPVAQTGALTGSIVSSVISGPVLNAAPYATEVNISGSPYLDQTLTGEYTYHDLEGNSQGASTYNWYSSDSPTGTLTSIGTALTYKITSAELNKYIFFEVVPIAASGTSPGIAVRSAALQVLNAAPTASAVTISGNPYLDQTLTGEYTYHDLEGNGQGASTYNWYSSDSPTGTLTSIGTALTYKITSAELNKYIFFEVVPVAASGNSPGIAVRSAAMQVLNAAPTASAVTISGSPYLEQTLTGGYTYYDLEGNGQGTSTYNWYSSDSPTGTLTSIGTALTYKITSAELNKYIFFEVVPVAASGTSPGIAVRSAALQVLNAAPTASAVTISGNPYLDQTLTGGYTYYDLEGNGQGTSTYNWYSSDSPTGTLTSIGTALTYKITSAELNKYIFFEVVPVAASGTSPGIAVRSAAVEVLNAAPTASAVTISGSPYLEQTLTGEYTYYDLEGNGQGTSTYNWYSSDSPTGTLTSIGTALSYKITSAQLNKYIFFEVVPVAASGNSQGIAVRSAAMEVLNAAPTASAVTISGSPYLEQTLTGGYTYYDLEGNGQGTSTYHWYSSDSPTGTLTSLGTALTYKITSAELNKYIFFEVVPVAASGNSPGIAVRSAAMEVLNEAPKADNANISGNMYLSQELTGTYGYSDLEGNPQGTSTFKWYRADDNNGPDVQIIGATHLKYTISADDLNKYISFEVTPVASGGTPVGDPVKSPRRAVLNEAPKASAPFISGNRYKNQEVTAEYTYSDLENNPQSTSTFRWFRSTSIGGPDVEISGAISKTYTITSDDLNQFISFEVTPAAQTGTLLGTPVRSDRYPVENEKPKASSVYISGNLYLNQDISGNYAYSDLENDPQGTSTFQWYRADNVNGPDVEITGATQTTYRITTADLNKYLSFRVWPRAASGTVNGDPVQSIRLAVKNERPKASSVDFSGNMYLSNTLTGTYSYSDLETDMQGSSVFKWYRADNSNGPDTEIVGENQITYTLTSQDLNKYISFEVTPVALSGEITGTPVRSSRKAVLNEAPKVNSLTIIGNRVLSQTLLASFIYSDLENDSEGTHDYQWYISDAATGPDVLISGAVNKAFEITRQFLGKYISFRVTPKALTGTIAGEQKSSGRFYINAAPNASNVLITGFFKIKQELQGTYSYADAENDPEGTSEFHWYRSDNADGTGRVMIVGENTSKYSIRTEDMNKYISFEVTPKANSGSLTGLPTASLFMGPVTNSVPTATNVRISGTQLVCKTIRGEYNYEDLEGDPEGDSQYKWYRASGINTTKSVIQGATGREYKLTTQDQGMYIFFEVLPRAISGTTSGSPTLGSPTGSIVNTLPTVTILGTSSICSGSTARLTISFTGSSPWKLWYTDGTQKYQLVSSDPVYLLNVSKGGTYKADTLVDNIGCPVTDLPSTATVSILPLPQVDIVGVNSAYNLRSNPVQLTGSPTGGTFSGPGVISSTSTFYPSIAGTQNSPHTIIYEYRSPQTGCSNRDTIKVEVIDADASISGLRAGAKYCNFDAPFVITGTNATGSVGSFAITGGIGLTDNNNNTATINPAKLAAGNYTISYSYFDGIQLSIYKDIAIEILDEAKIFGINNNTYCLNSDPLEIYSNYTGGTFAGNAVFKNAQTNKFYFNPALDVPGNSNVTYSYTTSYGCVISKSVEKFIAPVPTADFLVNNNCFNGDSTGFKNKTLSIAAISKWDWRFGDSQASEANNRSALFEPKHKYSSIGNRNVRLIAENIYGCQDTIDKIIHLGDIPVADFSWYSECFVNGYPVSFKNKSTNIDDITKYSWVIEDTSKLNFNYSTKDILHTFPVIKDFSINFKVTSEYGCSDSIKKVIRLRPIYYLKDTFYFNNFEAGNGYWLPTDSVMVNNWKFGTPNGAKINAAASGSKAYYTSLKDTRRNQQLIITSPCYSLKGTARPFISMDTYSDVVKGTEGTVLQYSEDNGSSWENVGGFSTGINWYNDFAILSQPGGQQIGWSDKFSTWTNARHNLDQIKPDSLIRFRLVFGQNSKATGTDGFAFDNLLIASRSKNVLFEHFTNNSQVESLKANSLLDSIISLNKEDAISIQYHTSYPGVDTFNMHNPSDPGSRVLYYGIGITPNAYLEGGTETRYIYDFNTKKPNTADIKNLSMKDVSFKLGLKIDKGPAKVSGTLDITAIKKVTGRNLSARIVVVEDIVSQIAGSQITYKNVVKKILPSAGGTILSTSWDTGKKESVNFAWDYKYVYNPANIHIVAFLQDELTRDIYQVVSDDTSKVHGDPGVGIKTMEGNIEVNVYPNPAKDLLVVEFSETPDNDQRIEIWSMNGKKVFSENLFKGVSRFETDVQNLENGLYFIRILNKNRVLVTKKLVILH